MIGWRFVRSSSKDLNLCFKADNLVALVLSQALKLLNSGCLIMELGLELLNSLADLVGRSHFRRLRRVVIVEKKEVVRVVR